MTLGFDHPDYLPAAQVASAPLHVFNDVIGAGGHTFQLGYVGDWDSIILSFQANLLTDLLNVTLSWCTDGTYLTPIVLQSYELVNTVPLVDIMPVCGLYLQVIVTQAAAGDRPLLTGNVTLRNGRSQRARNIGDGSMISVTTGTIANGGSTVLTPSNIYPGPAIIAASCSGFPFAAEVRRMIPGGGRRIFVFLHWPGSAFADFALFTVGPWPFDVLLINQSGAAQTFTCEVSAQWVD